MQIESPPQQADGSIDALYSLVVSVKSSQDIHEVYIDAQFHYTALKVKQHSSIDFFYYDVILLNMQILKLQHPGANRYVGSRQKFCIRNFKFASSESSLRLIMPEKNPYITAVEPEHGMVRCLNGQLVHVSMGDHLCHALKH